MKVVYHKMSLFDAPEGSVLVHAVNCQGVWGSGIAAEFHKRFPKSFETYEKTCLNTGSDVLGKALCTAEGNFWVASLFTSYDYGQYVDSPEDIIKSTAKAIEFFTKLVPEKLNVYSNQFNSNRFRVPWVQTESVLLNHASQRVWNVCTI